MKYLIFAALLFPLMGIGQTQKIEAESALVLKDVQTETTTDSLGGKNVGYIDAGDYMEYSVTVPTTGKYTIAFRVASTGAASFNLAVNGTNLGKVSIPITGGYQTWKTITQNFLLSAGKQTIRLTAATALWNINWFLLTYEPPVYEDVYEKTVTYDGELRKVYVIYQNGQKDSVNLPPRPVKQID